MIEAIPASADSIVLIITKVEDPEELDTRFSKFTPLEDNDAPLSESFEKLEGADEFLNLLNKVKEAATDTTNVSTVQDAPTPFNVRLFSFDSMDRVIRVAHLLGTIYHGSNTLYYDVENEIYILALTQSDHSNNEFNKICNMLSEYGTIEKASGATLAFLEEHCDIMISTDAVQKLSTIA
jgi:adapter protein MecA 1/2